jgi:polyphosphate kinase 2 (PPK2 family)
MPAGRNWQILRIFDPPERGRIGIFDRSHYEEVLIVHVHREILCSEGLPEAILAQRVNKSVRSL